MKFKPGDTVVITRLTNQIYHFFPLGAKCTVIGHYARGGRPSYTLERFNEPRSTQIVPEADFQLFEYTTNESALILLKQ